jgi:hypothetical protein
VTAPLKTPPGPLTSGPTPAVGTTPRSPRSAVVAPAPQPPAAGKETAGEVAQPTATTKPGTPQPSPTPAATKGRVMAAVAAATAGMSRSKVVLPPPFHAQTLAPLVRASRLLLFVMVAWAVTGVLALALLVELGVHKWVPCPVWR